MPHRVHVEHCACPDSGRRNLLEGAQQAPKFEPGICAGCGQAIVVQRWCLSVVEHWARAIAQMGFLVVAPSGWPEDHPGSIYVNAAREALFSLSARCEGCFGVGVIDDWKGDWRTCPYCEGVGRIPTTRLEALQAAHHRWFHQWPQFYRHSLLYGISDTGERNAYPCYDGPTISCLEDRAKQVVYGPVPYARIDFTDEQAWTFLPARVARRRANTMQIVFHATTWGALRRGLHPEELYLVQDADAIAFGDALPSDAEAFSGPDFFCDGFPIPQELAGDWFPAPNTHAFEGVPLVELDFREAYGEGDVPAVVAHLERHGFSVIRDDCLVSAAHMPDTITDARVVALRLGPHPEWPAWIVFHAPHVSTHVPQEVRKTILLNDGDLRQELDRLTDHRADWPLIPPGHTPAVVVPGFSRLVVDVERFLDDDHEPMARVGMGAIYTRTSDGRPLRARPSPQQRDELLDRYYHPHHRQLTAVVQAALDAHDRALILDLHTFPDVPLPCDLDQKPGRPDICIGTDEFHAPTELRDRIIEELTGADLTVAIDRPYSGTIVPKHILRSDQRVASIMIEVNRRLYLRSDGATPKPILQHVGRKIRDCVRRAVVEWGCAVQRSRVT